MDDIRILLQEVRDTQATLFHRIDSLQHGSAASETTLEPSSAALNQSLKTRMDILERKILGAAANEVLRIPELVEKILSELPNRDVLRQQEQSHFKNVADGSPAIQRNLFLIPDMACDPLQPRPNPLLFDCTQPLLGHPAAHGNQGKAYFNALGPMITQGVRCLSQRQTFVFSLGTSPSHVPGITLDHNRVCHLELDQIFLHRNGVLNLRFVRKHDGWRSHNLADETGPQAPLGESWRKMLLVQSSSHVRWYIGGTYIDGRIAAGTTAGGLMADW